MKDYLEHRAAFSKDPVTRFMLDHGQSFTIGPKTFEGPRMKRGECFCNATLKVLEDKRLLYVEGKVSIHGVPIDHAWNVDLEGNLIDFTLDNENGSVVKYFGVVFSTAYVRRATLKNGYYGLLDGYYARKTLPELVTGKVKFAPERQSPGFRRMMVRLGPDAAEKMRLDTVRLQEEALREVRREG